MFFHDPRVFWGKTRHPTVSATSNRLGESRLAACVSCPEGASCKGALEPPVSLPGDERFPEKSMVEGKEERPLTH